MPSYPAKPYVVPHDDWFNNNSSNFKSKPKAKGIKRKTSIHEFFYRQSHAKVGGSENFIQTKLEKKSSEKIIISSHQNSNKSVSPLNEEKYSYYKIPRELKSIKKRSFQANKIYKNLSYKNKFNLKSYLLDLKSFFIRIISRKYKHN
tara:strand:- start:175 stop:615 length:441 start_codon:yes stop_codon:yes gene_type:complete